MAGTVDLVQRVCTGIETTGGVLRVNPQLPVALDRLDMRVRYRGHTLDLRLTREAPGHSHIQSEDVGSFSLTRSPQ
jgi:trehalose/maltose hydrolase-like predicted phosphorylase